MLVVDGGKLTWPAPPYEPPPAPKQAVVAEEEEEVDPQTAINEKVQGDATALTAVAALTIGVGLASGGDVSNAALFGAFCLASFAGQQAVWGVAPALHSPLMAVTNAVSDSAWFPSISQLELRVDGVNAMPHCRDAVDVAVRESTRRVRELRQFRDAVVRRRSPA
jgi:hypothetical protein